CSAIFFLGSRFNRLRLSVYSADSNTLLKAIRFRNLTKFYTPNQIINLQKRLLSDAEQNGYPFAVVEIDSISQFPPLARIKIQQNEFFSFDTLDLPVKTRVKKSFLAAYLGIKKNKPYNESRVAAITQRLNMLPFVELVYPHSIYFEKEKARVQLHLKDRKASFFNAFVGFLPSSAGRQVLITGEVRLNLYGLIGYGEQIHIEWNKTLPQTQTLKTALMVPYLFGLPIGTDLRFELFKRDTSWLDLDRDFGLRYQFAGMNYLRFSLKQKTTIVQRIDTLQIKLNRSLPQALDINTNEGAVEYYFMNLDYRFNPTRGWQITAGISAGVKSIKRNPVISALIDESRGEPFAYLYDSIARNNFQFSWWLLLDKFWPVHKRMTVLTGLKARYFYSPIILENEKFRIGGMNTLRGFTEESIFTPYYGIANLEYRYLLSRNAYFFSFFNAAVIQRLNSKAQDYPLGFGAGVSLETKAGIFALSYAIGTLHRETLLFRNSKIHFGYVGYF
ncbi:MAG: BamA/TamA family outer membrane protein, partial [Chitinophagales bacterium]|nr:BamA/TamA family outer membrane protein [Chitinophagales bacterium]